MLLEVSHKDAHSSVVYNDRKIKMEEPRGPNPPGTEE